MNLIYIISNILKYMYILIIKFTYLKKIFLKNLLYISSLLKYVRLLFGSTLTYIIKIKYKKQKKKKCYIDVRIYCSENLLIKFYFKYWKKEIKNSPLAIFIETKIYHLN